MIRMFIKLLKALSSDANPNSLAIAICFAAIMGLTPLASPHNILFLFIILFFRIHLSTFIIALSGFAILGLLLDPVFDQFGYYLLTDSSLTHVWTSIYNLSLGRLSLFNNTIIMGSLIFSLLLFIPLFFFSKWLIIRYRISFNKWVAKSKLIVLLKSSSLFQMFANTRENSL
ncbi:MAG: hypothetical protein COA74_10390 [Gammaproteobacteria bacterium]|nr:MAG: hypothetical protein COA74_10390 [Gammaproteobacteria bacterium]